MSAEAPTTEPEVEQAVGERLRELPAVRERSLPTVVGPPGPGEWQAMLQQAAAIADTTFVPNDLRGNSGAVLAVFMRARELAIGPMYALDQLYVSPDGRIGMQAAMMVALARRHGHRIRIDRWDHQACTVTGTRSDSGESYTVTWTLEDALRAGLVHQVDDEGVPRARSQHGRALPWESYTRNLLWARAVSTLSRMLWPDALGGVTYTPEELDESTWIDEYGQPVEVEEGLSPEHRRWNQLRAELNEDQRAALDGYYRAHAGDRPFGLLPRDSQRRWTSWLATKISERRNPSQPAEDPQPHKDAPAGRAEPQQDPPDLAAEPEEGPADLAAQPGERPPSEAVAEDRKATDTP